MEPIIAGKKPQDTKVVVAMSGGVDSSTVAAYLHSLGYKVIGVTLQLYTAQKEGFKKTCCAGQDIFDAKNVASQFGFLHYVINMQKVFEKDVMEDFADTYLSGQTPVPCIRCNQTVKFRDLFKIAKDLKADALATGHYVQRMETQKGIEMHKGFDKTKDQSYFLFATTKKQLEFLRFPLGGFTKEKTRELAKSLGIKIAQKPESQDICFVKSKSYVDIINKLRPQSYKPGKIIHKDGTVLGDHNGIVHYTIGQRHGLNLSSYGQALYVLSINREQNQIIVGPKSALDQDFLHIKDINWLDDSDLLENAPVSVKLRSGADVVKATLHKEKNYTKVKLQEPANCAISPGQACVIYNKTRVLGGGWIVKKAFDSIAISN